MFYIFILNGTDIYIDIFAIYQYEQKILPYKVKNFIIN